MASSCPYKCMVDRFGAIHFRENKEHLSSIESFPTRAYRARGRGLKYGIFARVQSSGRRTELIQIIASRATVGTDRNPPLKKW
jgi:hypothetical protein